MQTKLNKLATIAATLLMLGGAASAQTIGFLMPDQGSTRYDERDWPGFERAMAELCPDCTPVYQNGNADIALQQQQFNSLIAQGAKIIVLDPVDSGAAAAGNGSR